jgi:hypothetical protein
MKGARIELRDKTNQVPTPTRSNSAEEMPCRLEFRGPRISRKIQGFVETVPKNVVTLDAGNAYVKLVPLTGRGA